MLRPLWLCSYKQVPHGLSPFLSWLLTVSSPRGGWKMLNLCTRKKKPLQLFHPCFCIVIPAEDTSQGFPTDPGTVQPCLLPGSNIDCIWGVWAQNQQELSHKTDPLGSYCSQGLLMLPNKNFCIAVTSLLSKYKTLASFCWIYEGFLSEFPMLVLKRVDVLSETLITAHGLKFPWISDSFWFSALLFFILDWPFCSVYSVGLFFSSCLEIFTKKPQKKNQPAQCIK